MGGGSFKSGSGDLDFGDGDDDEDDVDEPEPVETSASTVDVTDTEPVREKDEPADTVETPQTEQYPYFVRRSNVMDERDKRLELHIREAVASNEPTFRNDLADALDTDEVSKTDAREFALKFAFENPEAVADLMVDEGYNAL